MKRNLLKPLICSLVSASFLIGCNSGVSPNPKLNNSNVKMENSVSQSANSSILVVMTPVEYDNFIKHGHVTPQVAGTWSIQDANDPTHADILSGNVTNMDATYNGDTRTDDILINGINFNDPTIRQIRNKLILIDLKNSAQDGYFDQPSHFKKAIKVFQDGDKVLPGSTLNIGEQWDFIDTQQPNNSITFMIDADTHKPWIISYKSNQSQNTMIHTTNDDKVSKFRVGNHGMQAQFEGDDTWYSISANGIDTHNGITFDPTNLNFGFKNDDLFNGYRGHRHIDAEINGKEFLIGNEDGSSSLTHTLIPQEFKADDEENNEKYRKTAYPNATNLPDVSVSMLPHRTYNETILVKCKNDDNEIVPCNNVLDGINLTAVTQNETIPLSDISAPLKNALITNGIVQQDGSVNLLTSPRITGDRVKQISFSYTPYYAHDNDTIYLSGIVNGKTEISADIQVPKVDTVYNYCFETQLSNSRIINVDYSSDETKPSFNISDEQAGVEFLVDYHGKKQLDGDILQKEGRYGWDAKTTSQYTGIGSTADVTWDTFFLNHQTSLPMPIVFGVIDRNSFPYLSPTNETCKAYVTFLKDNSGGHDNYSVTISENGEPTANTANNVICTDNSDGTGTKHWNHAYSHYDRDYKGSGPSIRIFRN